jgi:resuscitation-promoting factor RpfA
MQPDSAPPAPVGVAISEPPIAPVAVSFPSEAPGDAAGTARRSGPVSPTRRMAGWAIDLAGVSAWLALHLFAAAHLAFAATTSETALLAPAPWLGAGAILAVAWSWVFVALWGRTPGMALTGQRLRTVNGRAPGPFVAFARAVLSLVSASAGLSGFVLALFDRRGQTMHDKLCRCIAVID